MTIGNALQSPKAKQYVIGALSLLVLGSGVPTAFSQVSTPPLPFQTDFYRFFAPDTVFYTEVLPTPEVKHRFYSLMTDLSKDGHAKEALAFQGFVDQNLEDKMGLGTTNCRLEIKPPAEKPKADPKATATPSATAKTLTQTVQCDWVLVTQLKEGIDYQALAQKLQTQPTAIEGNWIVLQQNAKDLVIGVDPTHLVFGSTLPALKNAIKQSQNPASVANNPLYQSLLTKIPTPNNGLFLTSSQTLTPMLDHDFSQLLGDSAKQVPVQQQSVTALAKEMMQTFPGTIGTIRFDGDQAVSIDGFSPVQWDKIQNPSSRTALQSVFTNSVSRTDLASKLPQDQILYMTTTSPKRYFDMILGAGVMDQAAYEKMQSSVQGILAPMGLDFEKNILGLFDNQIAVALRATETIEPLVFLNHSADTEQTLTRAFALAKLAGSTDYQEKTVGTDLTLQSIALPNKSLSVAALSQPKQPLILGTRQSTDALAQVLHGEKPALSTQPLYQFLTANQPDQTVYFSYMDFQQLLTKLNTFTKLAPPKTPPATAQATPSTTPLAQERFKAFMLQTFEGMALNAAYDTPTQTLQSSMRLKLTPQKP